MSQNEDKELELSEKRTALSERRTALSKERTKLSHHRTSLSEERNELAEQRVHLANQRTFLAWIRTGLALIGFGFTIDQFVFIVRKQNTPVFSGIRNFTEGNFSLYIGVSMVIFGILMVVLGYFSYRHAEGKLEGSYRSYQTLSLITVLFITLGGAFLLYDLFVRF